MLCVGTLRGRSASCYKPIVWTHCSVYKGTVISPLEKSLSRLLSGGIKGVVFAWNGTTKCSSGWDRLFSKGGKGACKQRYDDKKDVSTR